MDANIDPAVDATYGILIVIGITSLMLSAHDLAAATFGVGVLLSYIVHVFWRMKRFADEMEETVEEHVEKVVEDKI